MKIHLFLLFVALSVSVYGQNSISIENLYNASIISSTEDNFLDKISVYGVGYQRRVYKNFYLKGLLGIRKAYAFNKNHTVREDIAQFIFTIDVRYDVIDVILKEQSRLKIYPIISYTSVFQKVKDQYRYPEKNIYGRIQVGGSIDFRLWRGLGLTTTYYRRLGMNDSIFLQNQWQFGVNYTF